MEVNVFYYNYEELKRSLQQGIKSTRYTSIQQVEILKRILEKFGDRIKGTHGDSYIIVNNELNEGFNPYFNLMVTLRHILEIKHINLILYENRHELKSKVDIGEFICELSKDNLINRETINIVGESYKCF